MDTEGWLIVGAVAVLIALLFAVAVADSKEHQRLMTQCMASGLPEFECHSKLKQDTVPVFIPMPVGR